MGRTRSVIIAAAIIAAVAVTITVPVTASNGAKPPQLEFLGQAIIPTGATFASTVIGGLSSITYDANAGVFYALSDDQGQFSPPGQLAPARFYTLRIDLGDGHLNNGDVQFTDVTTLLAPNGQPYPSASLDPEGMTLAKSGELIVTSEGIASTGIPPWVRDRKGVVEG